MIEYYFDNVPIFDLKETIINIPKKRYNEGVGVAETFIAETQPLRKITFKVSCGKKGNSNLGSVMCSLWMKEGQDYNIDFTKRYKASFWAYLSNVSKNINGTWKTFTCWKLFNKVPNKPIIKLVEIESEPIIVDDFATPIIKNDDDSGGEM